ncbi:MAG: molybdopterin molybdotransferase MoeA [Isosphaeraceae bacterium]|nr:molybdopterin molybdotransferase MoeA [Isosphaeraceae bacterium]
MLSLVEARAKVVEGVEPLEAIEVSLTEALGLVLAEPVVADVDLPSFDRAALDGYAVRAADAAEGARLSVVGFRRPCGEVTVGPNESARVAAGDPMPVGTDAVIRTEDTRPEPNVGPPRAIEVRRPAERGLNVVARGYYLRAGVELASAGRRVTLPLIGLLSAQGCVHPLCHRRVRVAVLAVGDHWVGSGEAPVMHRERNATGPSVVAPCVAWGATAHDLGTVREGELEDALGRAMTAPVTVVVGASDGAIPNALKSAGVEPVFSGVSLHPGKRLNYGVVRDETGRVEQHVFHVVPGPIGALTVLALLVRPLIARLQGAPPGASSSLRAEWTGPHRATDDRDWAVPVALTSEADGRWRATPVEYRGKEDLFGFSRADALAILPARSGPWRGGEVVEVVPLRSTVL